MRFRLLTVLFAAGIFAGALRISSAGSSREHHSDLEITWHIFKPTELATSELSQLHVPTGFRLRKFAENAGNSRILAIGPNGNVYVTRREEGARVGHGGFAMLMAELTTAMQHNMPVAVVEAVVDLDEPPAKPEDVRA